MKVQVIVYINVYMKIVFSNYIKLLNKKFENSSIKPVFAVEA